MTTLKTSWILDEEYQRDLKEFTKALRNSPNVREYTYDDLYQIAPRYGLRTAFGSYAFSSTVKNRSAALTVYLGYQGPLQSSLNPKQERIIAQAHETLERVKEYLKKVPLAYVRANMGDNDEFNIKCHYFVSLHRPDNIRIALFFSEALFPFQPEKPGPEMTLIMIPEWHEKDRQILVFPEINVTFVLGSDYYGEVKKGFLRMGMYQAKKMGMLGLHAGAKVVEAMAGDELKRYSMLIFGLTATGKTTHSIHHHNLDLPGERAMIVQDDVVFLKRDGAALGTERGFFIKTDGLEPKYQKVMYDAAIKPHTLFENIVLDFKGNPYFQDDTITGNGRAIVRSEDLGEHFWGYNLPPASEVEKLIIFFITRRNTVVPIASKLTLEQAAAFFLLGESVESSGGDPTRAGQSVRVVGTNPFIIGDEAEEVNIFYDIIKGLEDKVEAYLLNTGYIGERKEDGKVIKGSKITVDDSANIIRAILRRTVKWEKDRYWNVLVPVEAPGVDLSKFKLENYYTQEEIKELVNQLREERIAYLENFKGVHPDIVKAIENW